MPDTTKPVQIEIPDRSTGPGTEAAIGLRESVRDVQEHVTTNPFDLGDALIRGILHRVRVSTVPQEP